MQTPEFRLIGYPLGHSISPQIHRKLFEFSGMAGKYELMEVGPDGLEQALPALRQLDGFNITIPYKQEIIPLLDEVQGRALRYGSVNTVKRDGGRLIGFNTDAEGFIKALEAAQIPLSGKVLVCGAGGVARMMACEALDKGCSLVVATRTISRARNFAYELSELYPQAEITASTLPYTSGSFDLILNGTPCGMYPNVSDCPLPNNVIRSTKAVFDTVYNPRPTKLLQKAEKAGAKVQGGLPMLVWQAAAAQELWLGADFGSAQIVALCDEMEQYLQSEFGG